MDVFEWIVGSQKLATQYLHGGFYGQHCIPLAFSLLKHIIFKNIHPENKVFQGQGKSSEGPRWLLWSLFKFADQEVFLECENILYLV